MFSFQYEIVCDSVMLVTNHIPAIREIRNNQSTGCHQPPCPSNTDYSAFHQSYNLDISTILG